VQDLGGQLIVGSYPEQFRYAHHHSIYRGRARSVESPTVQKTAEWSDD